MANRVGVGAGVGKRKARVIYNLDAMSTDGLLDLTERLDSEITGIEVQLQKAYTQARGDWSGPSRETFLAWKSRAEFAMTGKIKFKKKIQHVLEARKQETPESRNHPIDASGPDSANYPDMRSAPSLSSQPIVKSGPLRPNQPNDKSGPRPKKGRELAVYFMCAAERRLAQEVFQDLRAEAVRDRAAVDGSIG